MADEINILNGGLEQLTEIKSALRRLDELKQYIGDLDAKQKQLTKDIAAREKAMDSEINSTVTKRQAAVEKSFDEQIQKTRDKIKSVKSKRDKYKGTKVNERVSDETADLHEKIRSLKQDLKGVFTRQHISRFFNTGYFFSLYMPDGVGDFAVILLTIAVLLGIPVLVYALLPAAAHKIIVLIGLYLVVVLLAMWIFSSIFKNVRNKNIDSFRQAKAIREEIRDTRRAVSRKEKLIRKDTDESSYGLEKYDEEMVSLDNEIEQIVSEKKQALTDFETTTKKNIIEEIKARLVPEIEALKAQNDSAYGEQREAETQIKSLELEVSSKYAVYLGKENLSVATIDSLIEIINGGEATSISDALARYRQIQAEAKKENKKE